MAIRKRTWNTPSGESKSAWVVNYTDSNGKRRLKTFAKKREAEAWAAETAVAVKAGTHVAESASRTVAEAAESWLEGRERAGREAATLRSYRQHVDLHIIPRIGALRLTSINAPRLADFQDELARDLSPAMVRKVLRSLSAILKHAAGRGWIGRNPFADFTPEKHASAEARHATRIAAGRDYPSPEEIKRILTAADAAGPRARALVTAATFTGLRSSELRGLRWDHVDFERRRLTVVQRADERGRIGPPKSSAGRRTIPLSPRVIAALKEWKLAQPAGRGLVFGTSSDRPDNHSNIANRIFGPVMVAAKVKDASGGAKYSMHAFRHFACSWMLAEKANGGLELSPARVQRIMGHHSAAFTQDRYGHLFPSRTDEADAFAAGEAALLDSRDISTT